MVASVAGRSDRSRRLADAAELELLDSIDAVVATADVVLSIVPPAAARDVVTSIAGAAVRTASAPLVADLNAVSPATVSELAAILDAAGLELVDGSISGPPPRPGGRTTLYLAGPRAGELAGLPAAGLDAANRRPCARARLGREDVHGVRLQGHGRPARPRAALTAHAHGVLEQVLADLRSSYPDLVERANAAIARAAAKARAT